MEKVGTRMKNPNSLHIVNTVLLSLRKQLGFRNQQQLADHLGLNKSTLSTWKKRGAIADPDLIMSKCPGVTYSFLKTGKKCSPATESINNLLDTLTEEQRQEICDLLSARYSVAG
jgi:transcriptional regulator with XRE-family HTH domain